MRTGLYGKLPSKRDFIAIDASREFLLVWEAWLQGGISASSHALGEGWKQAFLTAPIWRFWLGYEICGEAIIGAFMPSIDGVGRYFPLTLFVRATDGIVFPPPEYEPQTHWFTAAEDLLLSALDQDMTLPNLKLDMDKLPAPVELLPPSAKRDASILKDGSVLLEAHQEPFTDVFASARMAGHGQSYSAASYWWTAGGENYPAMALAKRHMPNAFVFAGMLTSDFSSLRS